MENENKNVPEKNSEKSNFDIKKYTKNPNSSEEEEQKRKDKEVKKDKQRIKDRKKRNAKITVSAYISAIFLFILATIVSSFYGMYSTPAVNKVFENSNYSRNVYHAAYDAVESLAIKQGLPVEVFSGVITEEQVETHVSIYMNSLSGFKHDNLSIDEIGREIADNTKNYLKSTGVEITDELASRIAKFANKCQKVYSECIFAPHLDFCRLHKNIITMGFIAVIVFSAVVLAICANVFFANIRRGHQLLRIYSWITGGAGLAMVIPSGLLFFKNTHLYVSGVKYEYMFDLVSSYVLSIIKSVMYTGIFLMIVWIALIAIWTLTIKRKKK